MTQTLAITDFDFAAEPADADCLITVWLPEIELVIATFEPDDRSSAFLTAGLRMGARSKTLKNFNLMAVVEKAGYSRSTFFRLFDGYTGFLLKCYQLSCFLVTKVYARHLVQQQFSLEEFCKFTMDVFYGGACTVSHEILQTLWRENNLSHAEFHPYLADLAPLIQSYLNLNPQTQHLQVDVEELEGVLKSLDLDMLNARLEDNAQWGTPFYYKKLTKMLLGYLSACG